MQLPPCNCRKIKVRRAFQLRLWDHRDLKAKINPCIFLKYLLQIIFWGNCEVCLQRKYLYWIAIYLLLTLRCTNLLIFIPYLQGLLKKRFSCFSPQSAFQYNLSLQRKVQFLFQTMRCYKLTSESSEIPSSM